MADMTARQYLRLSDAKGGNSIEEQDAGNTVAVEEQGWSLGESYVDADRSASTYAKKERDDFDRLISDLKTGMFGAQVLAMWEGSRGSRKVREWVELIELCEETGVRIWVTTDERLYDASRWADKKSLLYGAIDSEGESHKNSLRGRRTAAAQAKVGRPHGRTPDGYKAQHNAETGEFENWIKDETRSPIIKELFELLESGHSLGGVAKLFEGRGYLNKSGSPFARQHLRETARRIAYIGKRIHKGVVYEGTWDRLVSDEQFYAVQRIIVDPKRKTTRTGRAKYELTGALRCGKCDGPIMVKAREQSYICRAKSCVKIQKDEVDAVILPALVAYLSRPDVYESLTARSADDPEVRKVRDQLGQARANKKDNEKAAREAVKPTQILLLSDAIDRLTDQIAALEARERELTLPPSLVAILGAGESVQDAWGKAPVSARREVANTVLTPGLLGQAIIMPAPTDQRVQAVKRIAWRTV